MQRRIRHVKPRQFPTSTHSLPAFPRQNNDNHALWPHGHSPHRLGALDTPFHTLLHNRLGRFANEPRGERIVLPLAERVDDEFAVVGRERILEAVRQLAVPDRGGRVLAPEDGLVVLELRDGEDGGGEGLAFGEVGDEGGDWGRVLADGFELS